MNILNIVTSPRKDQSASRALVDAFLREYMTQADDIVVDTLDVWQEWLPEFDAETINAKYKGVSGEPMTPTEVTAWEKIRELASRFQRADRIVMGVPMWNESGEARMRGAFTDQGQLFSYISPEARVRTDHPLRWRLTFLSACQVQSPW
jgi:FMN-dependent NADH-azoreductase